MSLEYPEHRKHTSGEMINKKAPLYRTHEVIAKGRRISSKKRTAGSMARAFLKRLDTVGLNAPDPGPKRKPGRPRKGGA